MTESVVSVRTNDGAMATGPASRCQIEMCAASKVDHNATASADRFAKPAVLAADRDDTPFANGRGDDAPLDPANRAIIESLQHDGRRSYADIAKEVGLSEAAVRRRVQHLRDSGVVQIVAVTDPLQLGFTRQALIGIRVEGDVREVAARIVPLPEVEYVVMCAGSFDLLVELVCEDDDRLLHVLNDSIRSIAGVRTTETFLYLKLAKQTYTWGTR